MFSLLSGQSGFFWLCSSMSWESRKAQAMPAGPPPTMTTSASICGRSILGRGVLKIIMKTRLRFSLLHFVCKRWNDIKQISYYSEVGDLKNRSFGIFINRYDAPRTFHSHDVLNSATDSKCEIEFRSNRLSR